MYCIVLYCIVLYCIVLYCIVLYCIVLYSIVFNVTNCHSIDELSTAESTVRAKSVLVAQDDIVEDICETGVEESVSITCTVVA